MSQSEVHNGESVSENLAYYFYLKDPTRYIFRWALICIAISLLSYSLLFVALPWGAAQVTPSFLSSSQLELINRLFVTTEYEHSIRVIFLIYISVFMATWIVYFKSRPADHNPSFSGPYAVQSLRRFLGMTAANWQQNEGKEDDEKLKEAFRRKAATSMEVIAILIVVATLILDQIGSLITAKGSGMDAWNTILIGMAAVFSLVSFIGFLVSVDALDTTFNRYVDEHTRSVALHYFYQITITPRYAAMVSMLLSMIMYTAYHSLLLGTISVAILLWMGYRLWFPNLGETLDNLRLSLPALTELPEIDDQGLSRQTTRRAKFGSGLLFFAIIIPVILNVVIRVIHA